MKKSLFLLLVIVLSLIPAAPVLAQDGGPMSSDCDPMYVVSDFENMFSDIQSFDDLIGALSYSSAIVMDCYDDWFNLLLDMVNQQFGGGNIPLPVPQPAPGSNSDSGPSADTSGPAGSLTARDAEAAIRAAFVGDIDTVNQYVCPSEQMALEEGASFPPDLVINDVSCQRLGDMMNCTFSVSSESLGGDLEDELNFQIEDELLCQTLD